MSLVPKKVFFVKGKGFHKIKLAAFEQALRDAGIEKYNLVKVSSILPPYCIEINDEYIINEKYNPHIIPPRLYDNLRNEFAKIYNWCS